MPMELYNFQNDAINQLLDGKHFIISGVGCLAKGTPIPLANGDIKNVEELKAGDIVLSYNEIMDRFSGGEIASVIRTCHKPKPMIELDYDGEKITTTYDHPFFNGEGYYPLYQLVWGEMKTSQRVQLKLLCEQYGQAFDNKAIWCKYCSSNEAIKGRQWVLQDNDGWENSKSPQSSSRKLVEKPYKIGMCKPFRLQQGEQQSGEPRVVFKEVQCLVGDKDGDNESPRVEREKGDKTNGQREGTSKGILQERDSTAENKYGKEKSLRQATRNVPEHHENNTAGHCVFTSIKVKASEPYYTISMREAPYTYCIGRKHYFITHNSGKTAMSLVWAYKMIKETGKNKLLVVTTASKSRTGDFENEADEWTPQLKGALSEFSVISWHKLSAWVNEKQHDIIDYVVVFDEVQRAKAGVSSGMGRAFLRIAKQNKDWAAFTGTPGDTWLSFYPYMQACGLVRNKTIFLGEYATVQTYKGYPEIVGWRYEDKLKDMWAQISYAPDTHRVMSELPEQTHKVFTFKKPTRYSKTLKTRLNEDGEFLDTAGALCAELRRQCFTKEKQEWIKDFVDGLESGCVFFYNFIKTGDMLEDIMKKALPKDAKIWRIDGKHHEIPTAETIGKKDMVLCQWQSGSEGLNLHFLNYMVIVEANYSYSLSIQGRGRIRRIGQKRPQFYFYLKTEGTIEEAIYEALRTKSDFAEDKWCLREGITDGED